MAISLSLTACSSLNPFEDEEEEPAVPAGPVEPVLISMAKVSKMELGRLYRSYVLTVEGAAPRLGYYGARLKARHDGEYAPDGFLEFDLVAIAPDEAPTTAGTERQRRIRADQELTEEQIAEANGLRVFASANAMERRFVRAAPECAEDAGESADDAANCAEAPPQ